MTVCMSWTIIHGRRLNFIKGLCVGYLIEHAWVIPFSDLFCGRKFPWNSQFLDKLQNFSTDIRPTHCTLAMSLFNNARGLSDQGYSHRLGWSGFNPTTFQGNNHISANIHNLAVRPADWFAAMHVATVDRARDRWLQIVWKWRFIVFKAWRCHESLSW